MPLQVIWGGLIAWYLFLAGLGAGAYFGSALANYLGKEDKALTRIGIFFGAPLVLLASLLLITDLGVPLRFLGAFLRPGSSMISIGTFIISIFIIVGFIHIALLLFSGSKLSRGTEKALELIGMIFAVATALYTGVLLGVVKAIPFWNTPILPILFLVSALSTGVGLLILVRAIYRLARGAKDAQALASFRVMEKSDMVLIGVEALALLFLFVVMFGSTTGAAESAVFLLAGSYAVVFWFGVVVVGLILPLALEALSESGERTLSVTAISGIGIVSGICLLIGGLLLRYSILVAGLTRPLT